MGVMRISAHSLTSGIGIGSRPQDVDGEDFRILSRLSSDTGVKEDSVFLVELGLVTEDGVDDCSVDLILRILSEKNLQKVFARSVLFVQSGRTATDTGVKSDFRISALKSRIFTGTKVVHYPI